MTRSGYLDQAEFLDGLPSLVAVDQDVIGGDQEGLEDAPVPDRVTELGVFVAGSGGRTGASVSRMGGDLLDVRLTLR